MSISSSAAADTLFRKHNAWLNGWLRGQSRSVSAEDVASEVFLRLLRLHNVTELYEPRAMMATIARRVIYETRKRAASWKSCEAELMALPESLSASPEEHAMAMDVLRAVDVMLSTLPPKARAAFLFYRIDGMKQEAIASEIGVSLPTVERYLAQAMRRAVALRTCDKP